jgi:hypothetical protein
MPNSEDRRRITIEDLLHLKRAERPAPEFWVNFEHELRQKQLTALMKKRTWWQEMPQLFARRAYLPLSATAVLAFTLVTVKYYTPLQVAQVENPTAGSSTEYTHQDEIQPVAASAISSPLVNHSDQATQRLDDRATVSHLGPHDCCESCPLGTGRTGTHECGFRQSVKFGRPYPSGGGTGR